MLEGDLPMVAPLHQTSWRRRQASRCRRRGGVRAVKPRPRRPSSVENLNLGPFPAFFPRPTGAVRARPHLPPTEGNTTLTLNIPAKPNRFLILLIKHLTLQSSVGIIRDLDEEDGDDHRTLGCLSPPSSLLGA